MSELEKIKSVLRKEKPFLSKRGVNTIGIFGSYVRGENNEDSDIDILIDCNEDSNITLFSLIEMEMDLSEKLDHKVDLVIKSDLKPHLGKRILSEVEYV
ncbi:MAG: nucleotidyltransferase family protein [Spirochaetota bacterium]